MPTEDFRVISKSILLYYLPDVPNLSSITRETESPGSTYGIAFRYVQCNSAHNPKTCEIHSIIVIY